MQNNKQVLHPKETEPKPATLRENRNMQDLLEDTTVTAIECQRIANSIERSLFGVDVESSETPSNESERQRDKACYILDILTRIKGTLNSINKAL